MTEMASLVLFAADSEATAAFYRALGVEFEDEDHGEGPVHSRPKRDRSISRFILRKRPAAQLSTGLSAAYSLVSMLIRWPVRSMRSAALILGY